MALAEENGGAMNKREEILQAAMDVVAAADSLAEMLNEHPDYFGDRVIDVRDASDRLLKFYEGNLER